MSHLAVGKRLYDDFAAVLADTASDIAWTQADVYPAVGTICGPRVFVEGRFTRLATA